jgi:integrase
MSRGVTVDKRGDKWVVRWREPGRRPRRTFDNEADAELLAADIIRRKRLGTLALLDAGTEMLDDYVADVWVPSHTAHLAPRTFAYYTDDLYDPHISPTLGKIPLRQITPEMIGAWQATLLRADVGRPTVQKARTLLGAILQRAFESQRIAFNPQRLTRPVARPAQVPVAPLAPATVEQIRDYIAKARGGRKDLRWMHHRDATLISVLAYAGLRPEEARLLRWADVRDATLLVRSPKTRDTRPLRTVRLLAPLAADLKTWRLAAGRPDERAPMFPGHDRKPWTANAYAQWRGRVWKDALESLAIEYRKPYALRHSFASLLLHEGRSLPYVAEQLGHSVAVCARTYAHVMSEFEDQPRIGAADAIRAARVTRMDPERTQTDGPTR